MDSMPAVSIEQAKQSVEKVAPKPVFRDTPVGSLRSAHQTANFADRGSLPGRLLYTLDNSAETAAKNYLLFDPIGMVASLTAMTKETPAPNTLTNAIINSYIAKHAVLFSGIRIQVTSSVTQFNNELTMYQASIDGSINQRPLHLQDAIEGDKFDEKIQTYMGEIFIDSSRAIKIPVNAGQKVYMTFYIKSIYDFS